MKYLSALITAIKEAFATDDTVSGICEQSTQKLKKVISKQQISMEMRLQYAEELAQEAKENNNIAAEHSKEITKAGKAVRNIEKMFGQ